jgi:sec-independent protein translocase protein TatB
MFDIGPSELLLIVIVAVIAIGPKELPSALRTVGRWMGQMRRISTHFRTGLDAMIREAEMQELEQRWAEQNAKIMREHPADAPPEAEPTGAYPSPFPPAPQPPPPPAPAEATVVTVDNPDEYRDIPVSGDKPEA